MPTVTAPVAGQIWRSAKDPTFTIYIEAIGHADDGSGGFAIEARTTNTPAGEGIDIDDDDWRELVAEHHLKLLE